MFAFFRRCTQKDEGDGGQYLLNECVIYVYRKDEKKERERDGEIKNDV